VNEIVNRKEESIETLQAEMPESILEEVVGVRVQEQKSSDSEKKVKNRRKKLSKQDNKQEYYYLKMPGVKGTDHLIE